MFADISTLMGFFEIYQEFVVENFATHLTSVEKFTKITLNWDTETPGGITEFLTNTNAVEK